MAHRLAITGRKATNQIYHPVPRSQSAFSKFRHEARGLCGHGPFFVVNYFVNQTVLNSLVGLQVLDSGAVLHDCADWLSTGGCNQFAGCSTVVCNFAGFDSDIGGLPLCLRTRLIEEDSSIRQGKSVATLSLRQEHGSGSKSLTKSHSVNGRSGCWI